jgi:hypothetical protein
VSPGLQPSESRVGPPRKGPIPPVLAAASTYPRCWPEPATRDFKSGQGYARLHSSCIVLRMAVEDHLSHIPRWLAGASGGLAISIAQVVGQGHGPKLADFITHGEWRNAMTLILTTLFGITILMALGSLVALFEDEDSRRKLFLMGVAAPALFTAAMPSVFAVVERKVSELAPISTAQAAENTSCDQGGTLSWVDGLKLFFGADEPRYRVIVGSFKSPSDATALVAKVNTEDPSLHAFVAQPAPCNPYYAVVASPYLPAAEAKRVQDHVLKLESVSGAFLSPYRYR